MKIENRAPNSVTARLINFCFPFVVSLVYGGHVTDSADLEVLENIAETCFTTVSRHLNSGPHILSKLVRTSGHSGN